MGGVILLRYIFSTAYEDYAGDLFLPVLSLLAGARRSLHKTDSFKHTPSTSTPTRPNWANCGKIQQPMGDLAHLVEPQEPAWLPVFGSRQQGFLVGSTFIINAVWSIDSG